MLLKKNKNKNKQKQKTKMEIRNKRSRVCADETFGRHNKFCGVIEGMKRMYVVFVFILRSTLSVAVVKAKLTRSVEFLCKGFQSLVS